jgi:signal transduction histidine kinase
VVGWLEHGGRDRGRDNRLPPKTAALVSELASYYQTNGQLAGSEPLLMKAQSQALLDQRPDRIAVYFLTDADRRIIYHLKPELVEQTADGQRTQLTPIVSNNQTVGYLGSASLQSLDDNPPDFFVQILIRTLLTAAIIAGLGGITFGVVMSRSLTAPLRDLALAAQDIGARKLNRRVEERGADEIKAVAHSFNNMAADLQQGETLRRNLLADVAHELRTPLTVLQGNLRAILDEVFPMNEEEMGRLYEHTRFLSRLVNDLHELAQAEAHQLPLDLQPTSLNPLTRTACDNFNPAAAEKEIEVKTALADALPPVNIDAARITQVLQNLLANALRHTPAGGSITVKTQAAAGTVQLTITDTGEGIAPEHLPHVFDRFYRADPARARDKGGAGLGLAIVRAIVEAHHGQITAASAGVPGQGTTFTITLPKNLAPV